MALFANALTTMTAARLAGGELINSVAFGACARALVLLKPTEAVPALEEAMRFCLHQKCHYEARQESGGVALALAAAGAKSAVPAVRAFLERWQSVYPGERFIMEPLYALWLLDGDAAGARAYLDDDSNTKGHSFAVAALADLNAQDAIPAIEAKRASIKNPVTLEAFDEGLSRLRTQTAPPALADRMISLFGLTSRTEQALGADTDDVFLMRARAKTRDGALGQVTEVDDAAEED